MPHITSNIKRKRFKHYSKKNNNKCKCQEKIKAKIVVQEKKTNEKIQKIKTEDIVAEVFV